MALNVKDEFLKVLTKLVSYKTTSDNQEELNKCCNYIARYFKDEKVFVKKFMCRGVPSIMVSINETTHPKVILNAHFDVVPAGEDMFHARVQDNMVFGRGVIDDKGPLAVSMVLMKEMSGRNRKHDFALLLTGDEEIHGKHGVRHVLEEGIRSDFALAIDGGSPNQYVVKAKGILRARLTARGDEAHGSRPWLGDNAVEKLLELYPKVKKLFKTSTAEDKWKATCVLSKLHGGDADNKIPGVAEMILDIRYTENEEIEGILEKMRKIISPLEDVTFKTLRVPPFAAETENSYFKKLMAASEKVYGEEPGELNEDGGSDAIYFEGAGIPSTLTRPRGGGVHGTNEYLDLESIEDFYNLLRTFVMKID